MNTRQFNTQQLDFLKMLLKNALALSQGDRIDGIYLTEMHLPTKCLQSTWIARRNKNPHDRKVLESSIDLAFEVYATGKKRSFGDAFEGLDYGGIRSIHEEDWIVSCAGLSNPFLNEAISIIYDTYRVKGKSVMIGSPAWEATYSVTLDPEMRRIKKFHASNNDRLIPLWESIK